MAASGFDGAEVRPEPGTTKNKNKKGRTFPFATALHALLEERQIEHEKLKKGGSHHHPKHLLADVADERGGVKNPRAILRFEKQ